MNEPIKIKKEGSILEVTIDRPKANAIDSKTSIILGDIFADFRDNPDLRVAILTGAVTVASADFLPLASNSILANFCLACLSASACNCSFVVNVPKSFILLSIFSIY